MPDGQADIAPGSTLQAAWALVRMEKDHAAKPGDIAAFMRLVEHRAASSRAIAEALIVALADNTDLRGKLMHAAERIAAQSELLSKRAEKSR